MLAEVEAAVTDAGTQWMVFVCAGMYFVAFGLLRTRLGQAAARGEHRGPRMADGCEVPRPAWEVGVKESFRHVDSATPWLVMLMALAAMAYARRYAEAARSTAAIMLLGGAVLGQGASFWESRKQRVGSRKGTSIAVLALVLLLAGAAFWQAETAHLFQYRGEGRWTGPWDNPNMFGVLMGVGAVLALGSLMSQVQSLKSCGGEHPTSNIQHPTFKLWRWVKAALLLAAAGAMGVGLVKSYSRGAWVGAAVGMAYLAYQVGKAETLKTESGQEKAESRKQKAEIPVWRWGALAVMCASVAVLGFWDMRELEGRVARRAFSVVNANDFSWRKRVAAYEGALQMLADKPWFGYGWNQPERVYDALYRPAKVDEGMAIQLNDYLMLGMTLGVPALACFCMYAGLSLRGRQKAKGQMPKNRAPASDTRRETPDLRPETLAYPAVCRAGAVVLLVGFWFDGGLFKLATGATFWILLGLGRGEPEQPLMGADQHG